MVNVKEGTVLMCQIRKIDESEGDEVNCYRFAGPATENPSAV